MARDIILNLAISLDGFICDEDGGFAWISGQGDSQADTADHFDFDAFLASCDTIVMGRKAYEDCFSSLTDAADKQFLVASRTPRRPEGSVVFLAGDVVAGDVVAEVLARKGQPGKHIWLFGGGQVASALLRAGLVDEAVIGVLPIILGAGRRLFVGEMPTRLLHLQECTVTDGIAMLHYTNRGRS